MTTHDNYRWQQVRNVFAGHRERWAKYSIIDRLLFVTGVVMFALFGFVLPLAILGFPGIFLAVPISILGGLLGSLVMRYQFSTVDVWRGIVRRNDNGALDDLRPGRLFRPLRRLARL